MKVQKGICVPTNLKSVVASEMKEAEQGQVTISEAKARHSAKHFSRKLVFTMPFPIID